MKIFDLHADIGWDILRKHEQGRTHVLREEHLPKLIKGEVLGVGIASYFEGSEDWDRMQKMVLAARQEIEENLDAVTWIKSRADLEESGKPQVVMTVEGMCGIRDQAEEKIQWLYDQGVRIASLCWNDENALATGVKGTVTRGLTEEGRKAVRKMDELGMILDVSHTNEKTFWDMVEVVRGPLIATHSNTRALCEVHRNLTDQQIMAIAAKGGVIGLNAARNFIDSNPEHQDALHLAAHGRHIADLVGVEHLAVGFDFMDFFEDHATSMGTDLTSALQAQNLIQGLRAQGFSEDECQAIGYDNALRVLRQTLKQ
ncbi:dipeptidase [Holdemania filiformis]|uniref:dipeptidase n=1 Tax=Holdemania filiformis TaxID=61171 RepID=UPI00242D4F6B|nr:membrane dipeptidase [Holdemania filiformis]